MSAIREILTNAAKRALSLMLIPIAFALVAHLNPMTMDWAPHEGGSVVSDYDRAMNKAMSKCDELPEGMLPGAVVIDYDKVKGAVGDPLPIYSKLAFDVDQGFKYAIQKFEGVSGTVQDKYIEGVTLCK